MSASGLWLIGGPALFLSLVPGVPLALALLCGVSRLRAMIRRLLPWVAGPALLAGLFMPLDIVVSVPWFFMGGLMGIDGIGRILLWVSGFVWLLAGFRVRSALVRQGGSQARFIACFLTAQAGNFGLILAQGMLGFYLFFAVMSLAVYGLVIQPETGEARRAGRIYLVMVMIGEVCLFTALVMIFGQTNSPLLAEAHGAAFSPLLVGLLFIGFGVKIGALPCHLWMVPVYRCTPIPAAVALAGGMINAGILGWLRFLPLGHVALPAGALVFVGAGAMAVLYGVLRGLGEQHRGAVLAWSSISQMGLLTVIVGLGLLSPELGRQSIPLILLCLVHHALAKSCLFLGYEAMANHPLTPVTLPGLLLPGLALAGLPLTSGAIAKLGFKELAQAAGSPWYDLGTIFLPLSSVATTILILHFVWLFAGKNRAGAKEPRGVWLISLVAVAATLWFWPVSHPLALETLAPARIWQSLWPVAVGGMVFSGWKYFAPSLPAPRAGDHDPVAWFLAWARKLETCLASGWSLAQDRIRPRSGQWWEIGLEALLRKTEKVMGRWSVVGLFYLALCLVLLLLGN